VNAAAPVRKFVAGLDAQHDAFADATDALPMPLVNTIAGGKVAHHRFAPRERTFWRAPTSSINHCRRLDRAPARAGDRLSDGLLPCALYLFRGNPLA
jgi:hypothetical protein